MATILIVEDDPVMIRMYQRIFSIEGHTVVLAGNGEEGIQKAKEVKPELMLLDIMMPKMNGFQVLEKLKKDPQTSYIPVVMLTNLAGTQEMENAMSHGAIKYLIKSELEPRHLTAIIKEVLAGLSHSNASPGPTGPAPSAQTDPSAAQSAPPAQIPQTPTSPTQPQDPSADMPDSNSNQ